MKTAATVGSRHASHAALDGRKRWLALMVLCLGVLMIVLGATGVNVALPSIREDLKFKENSLVWVINAYTLTFGGSLLLGGRLGDLYGHRRLLLIGIALFTIASLACGLTNTQGLLVAARAFQGFGGAVVLAVTLALITNMFTDDAERSKALRVYSFVIASGGSIGLLLGGTLTSAFNWHWIFLVNLPIGVAVYALCLALLPNIGAEIGGGRLDIWGAVTVMMSLTLSNYAIVSGNQVGWNSAQTLGLLACAVVLLAAFITMEARVPTPLLPLGIFKQRNFTISNIVAVLWSAAGWAWGFTATLYMQLVLGCGPMQVGLAFLPLDVIAATLALSLSAKRVTRYGVKRLLVVGLMLFVIGLAVMARAPVDGGVMTDVLPSMVLLGLGTGLASKPLLLAAMSDVAPSESGIASGMLNTAYTMGGAFGLAILASFSVSRTNRLLASGATTHVALSGGYHLAFMLSAICAGTAAVLSTTILVTKMPTHVPEQGTIGAAVSASAKD